MFASHLGCSRAPKKMVLGLGLRFARARGTDTQQACPREHIPEARVAAGALRQRPYCRLASIEDDTIVLVSGDLRGYLLGCVEWRHEWHP